MISFEDREQLLKEEPTIYYLKAHYQNHPSVLVRPRGIRRDALRDLLRMAWTFVPEKARAPRRLVSPARLTSDWR